MSEAIKPTPGPWVAKSRDVYHGRKRVVFNANAASKEPLNMKEEFLQAEANARLIAAAPDLLEALREIFHDAKQGAIPNDDDEWWKKASTAIAKATGEQT